MFRRFRVSAFRRFPVSAFRHFGVCHTFVPLPRRLPVTGKRRAPKGQTRILSSKSGLFDHREPRYEK